MRGSRGGLVAGGRPWDDALDGEEALVDLAQRDFDGVQALVETDVGCAQLTDVVAHVVDAGVHAADDPMAPSPACYSLRSGTRRHETSRPAQPTSMAASAPGAMCDRVAAAEPVGPVQA